MRASEMIHEDTKKEAALSQAWLQDRILVGLKRGALSTASDPSEDPVRLRVTVQTCTTND